jgi:threonine/homoserine/homoserine lactone efflux protein
MFRQGLWNNVLNPKMALFVVALFPQFVDPAGASIVLQMLLLATILNAIGLVVNGAVIVDLPPSERSKS